MKTRKTMFGIFTAMALAIITLGFIASCDNGDKETHTHQWQWQVTKAATTEADGEETETCACGATNGTRAIPKLIQREYNDLIFMEKNIKLIDQTNGATDLKARGIHGQIQGGLNDARLKPDDTTKFNKIYASGDFAIVIESGADYIDGYSTSGHQILFRENQLSGFTSYDIGSGIQTAIRFDMTVPDDDEE
jgi:hypothetical protein